MWRLLLLRPLQGSRLTSYLPRRSYGAYHSLLQREVDTILNVSRGHQHAGEKAGHCRRSFELIATILSSPDLDRGHIAIIEELMAAISHRQGYDEDAFNDFSNFFLDTSIEEGMNTILPHFVTLCRKQRYCNFELLQRCAQYVTDNIHNFHYSQICAIVSSLAVFYSPNAAFVKAVEDRLINSCDIDGKWGSRLCWNLVYYGMVHRHYPARLLDIVLTDDYIRANLGYDNKMLFLLHVALSFDCPELNHHGSDWSIDTTWGKCPSLKNVSEDTFRLFYNELLQCEPNTRSQFHSNVSRALRLVLGSSGAYHHECLSLSGYSYDFQVLFDRDGNVLQIPTKWKLRSKIICGGSIGLSQPKRALILNNGEEKWDIIDSLKKSEASNEQPLFKSDHVGKYQIMNGLNLACDWGSKFFSRLRAANIVVIEANGRTHYAQNMHHSLGNTRLKKRLTEFMGWKCLMINYRDWGECATGDDQVKFIRRLLKPFYNGRGQ